MTSSNAVAEPAGLVETPTEQNPAEQIPAEQSPQAADGGPAAQPLLSRFEFLTAGETFGVCDVDGECR